jgi:hypothetical protein
MKPTPGAAGAPRRLILAFVAAAAAAKLAAALFTGFDDDEAYTLVVARTLALSYFDHPPLHQWILHGFVRFAGEGHWDRLPFWAIHVATNLPLYGLTRRLFGLDAALWAIFAFNASAYFLLLPDGYILPDPPLLLALTCAVWAIAEILYASTRSQHQKTMLWIAAGAAFGLAGLAKYSAALGPLGLAGFFLFSPTHRRWFADLRPYAAAALALAVFSPALIWNAQNGFVSLAFQSGRAEGGFSLDGRAAIAILEALAGQIASLSPWIAIPVIVGLWRARRGDADSGARLLLWLSLPPLLLFAALPLVGQRAIPHWFNSGWIFCFPLAGAWLASLTAGAQRLWAKICVALSASAFALYLAAVTLGPATFLPEELSKFRDPTATSYDWDGAVLIDARANFPHPAFALVDNWRIGGRVGVALGPETPICGFGPDPRGLAFTCQPSALIGRDALIVGGEGDPLFAGAAPYFERIAPPAPFSVGRGGRTERRLYVARASGLKAPYPLPYGPDSSLSRR